MVFYNFRNYYFDDFADFDNPLLVDYLIQLRKPKPKRVSTIPRLKYILLIWIPPNDRYT
jgi:hypothetical protein